MQSINKSNLLHLAIVTANNLRDFFSVVPLKIGQAAVQNLDAT
jgi:hypothetical protein